MHERCGTGCHLLEGRGLARFPALPTAVPNVAFFATSFTLYFIRRSMKKHHTSFDWMRKEGNRSYLVHLDRPHKTVHDKKGRKMANVRHWIARSVLRLSLLALATVAMLAMLAQPASAAVVHHSNPATHIGSQTFRTDRYGDKIYTVSTATGPVTVIIGRRTSPALRPYSASGCVGNLPWNNVQTCFGIVGSGRYVDGMWVTAYVRNSTIEASLAITGPYYGVSTGLYTVPPGYGIGLSVDPDRNMLTGKYCGSTDVDVGTGSGTACESVVA
jgi:hypothetical protein